MAKPNNNKNKKQNQDYFSKSIQQKGEGFIQTKSPQELQRDAIRIFRDIARGNINLEKMSSYIMDQTMMSNMIIAARSKLTIETIRRDGVSMLYTEQLKNPMIQDTGMVEAVLQNQIALVEAYSIICNILDQVQITNDPAWLYTLAAQLSGYKYII